MPTESNDINVALHNHVATVELNRPPHNFFDRKLIARIADAFDEFDENPECRAIVLASNGKSFCAGANFGQARDTSSSTTEFTVEGFEKSTGLLYREGVRLFSAKKPIVGAIQGAAIGGGLGLALVPDFRVASPEARFGANFAKLGIHPGFGLTVTLPNLVGQQQANLMFLTARRLTGQEAQAIGLVDVLVAQDELRASAQSLAAEIAENAPLAVVSVRTTMRHGLAEKVAKATNHELAEQQWLRATNDAEEGVRAVAERRPGKFTGT